MAGRWRRCRSASRRRAAARRTSGRSRTPPPHAARRLHLRPRRPRHRLLVRRDPDRRFPLAQHLLHHHGRCFERELSGRSRTPPPHAARRLHLRPRRPRHRLLVRRDPDRRFPLAQHLLHHHGRCFERELRASTDGKHRRCGGSSGIVYGGLKYQARCIADVRADAGSTTFLAGTLGLKEENEVHLIRLLPGENELVCDGLFYHPNEIWDLKSCPFDHRLFSTVYTSGEGYGASVWKIPELYGQSNSPQLEELFTLDEHTAEIRCVLWWPLGKHDKLISIDERNIFLWNIDPSNKSAKVISQGSADMLPNFELLGRVEATARAATTPLLIRFRSARRGRSNRSGGHHASPHPSSLQAAYQMPQSSSSWMSAGAETAVPD